MILGFKYSFGPMYFTCIIFLNKYDFSIGHVILLLDYSVYPLIIILQLAGPVDGNCIIDRFIVTGQNSNDIIPPICGLNTDKHGEFGVQSWIRMV